MRVLDDFDDFDDFVLDQKVPIGVAADLRADLTAAANYAAARSITLARSKLAEFGRAVTSYQRRRLYTAKQAAALHGYALTAKRRMKI